MKLWYALLLAGCVAAHAQNPAISYPAAGNIRPEQGTVEMWLRLEDEPNGTGERTLHHFSFFNIEVAGEKTPRVRFIYQTIWGPQSFHVWWASWGRMENEWLQNPYVTTVEDTQASTKADYSPLGAHPRTPRLHKGEWHHLAVAWTNGLVKPVLMMYLDGKLVLRPYEVPAVWWDNMEATTFWLSTVPNHDNLAVDELRISDVALTAAQAAASFAGGALKRDTHTLLLDHCDRIENGQTVAEQIAGYGGEKGGKVTTNACELVDGKFGKALRIKK